MNNFPTQMHEIISLVDKINPVDYAKTRNYSSGHISRLGPYISRGVITPSWIYHRVRTQGFSAKECFKFLQELTWREYYQSCWEVLGDKLFDDLKHSQGDEIRKGIPRCFFDGSLGVDIINGALNELNHSGFIHNHLRMYLASMHSNFADCDWRMGAKWFYYHLLDGDIASNTLSWQWVAGTFSNKKYWMNQSNMNHFFEGDQQGTFLDTEYENFPLSQRPAKLQDVISPQELELYLSIDWLAELKSDTLEIKETILSNYYHLDPLWHQDKQDVQRVLLLEPSHFQRFPISSQCAQFMLDLSQNIPNIKIFVGEFSELKAQVGSSVVHYQEHPTCTHYQGHSYPKETLHPIQGYHPSFFKYWKKCTQYRIALDAKGEIF